VEHESAVGVDENMPIGVDPAEIFAGKPVGSRYVGDVDETREGLLPAAARLITLPPEDQPTPAIGGAQARMASELRRQPQQGPLSACGGKADLA
jgi:hypothetical protein